MASAAPVSLLNMIGPAGSIPNSTSVWCLPRSVFNRQFQLHFATEPLADRVKSRAHPSSHAFPAPRRSITTSPLLSTSLLSMCLQQLREQLQSHRNYLPNSSHQPPQVIQATPLLGSTARQTQLQPPIGSSQPLTLLLLSLPCLATLVLPHQPPQRQQRCSK